MPDLEYVYLGHDNTIDLILKSDGSAVDLSAVTKITANFGGLTITSTDKAAGDIKWDQSGYDTGEIRISAGAYGIGIGRYKDVSIVVYDATWTNGLVWGFVEIEVQAEVEN